MSNDPRQKSQLLTNSVVKEFLTTAAKGRESGERARRLLTKLECPSQATIEEFLIVRRARNLI